MFRQFWCDLAAHYPSQFKEIRVFHAGMFANLLVSMTRHAIPTRIHKKFQMGSISGVGRLDAIYLTPTLEVANQRLLVRVQESLQLRYANEASFRL